LVGFGDVFDVECNVKSHPKELLKQCFNFVNPKGRTFRFSNQDGFDNIKNNLTKKIEVLRKLVSMKKKIKIIISIFLIGIIGYLGFSIGSKLNHKKEVAERIKTIPKFSFKKLNGEAFTQKELNTTLPKLFIYFNSECEFCQGEAEQIQKNITQLQPIQIVMVSHESSEGIKNFAEKYHLINQKNILFLEDSTLLFSELFNAKSIPFLVLYSKNNQLIQKFKGATKIENVIKLLE